MPIRATLVGSGAVRVNPSRGGTCQVVSIGKRNLLIDCGRNAVHNMTMQGYPVESIDEVYITHLHFDHVCDLAQFILLSWNNGRRTFLPVYGPKGLGNFMENGIRKAYADDIQSRIGLGRDPTGYEWKVTEISNEGILNRKKNYTVHTLRTEHAALINFHFRIDCGDKRIVVSSDTRPDKRLINFCMDADLLIMECSGTQKFLQKQGWTHSHMHPAAVGKLAEAARVKKTVIKHLVIENFSDDPDISDKMAQLIRRHYKGEVLTGSDGMQFDFMAE